MSILERTKGDFSTTQKFNLDISWKKIKFLGFCAVVGTRGHLSIDVPIGNYYYRIDIDEARVISFLGVQTRFRNPHLEACRHTKNLNSKFKLGVSCQSLYASPSSGDA